MAVDEEFTLESLRKKLDHLKSYDVAKVGLPDELKFKESAMQRDRLCSFLEACFETFGTIEDRLEQSYKMKVLGTFHQHVKAFAVDHCNEIDGRYKKGHDKDQHPDFEDQRDKLDVQSKQIVDGAINSLAPYFSALTAFKIERDVEPLHELASRLEKLSEFESNLTNAVKQTRQSVTDADGILTSVRDEASKHAVNKSSANFGARAGHHRRLEYTWLGVSCLTIVVISYFVFDAVSKYKTDMATNILIGEAIKRMLTISIPVFVLKLGLTRYNLERNLRIIYEHRVVVLKQYSVVRGIHHRRRRRITTGEKRIASSNQRHRILRPGDRLHEDGCCRGSQHQPDCEGCRQWLFSWFIDAV